MAGTGSSESYIDKYRVDFLLVFNLSNEDRSRGIENSCE